VADGMIEASGDDLDLNIADSAVLTAKVRVSGHRNRLFLGEGVTIGPATSATDPQDPAAVIIDGDDNEVVIHEGTVLGLRLIVRGRRHRVEIGPRCILQGRANLLGAQSGLFVGAGTTMVEGSLQLHEAGEIRIGADCMISSQVYASLSDMHPIYDLETGERINPPASIQIGDHVWLGLRCMILKGAEIGEGAVVAAGAVLSGKIPAQAVAAGVPARVVRENVAWRRDFDETPPRID
jgi:acetyltransferase-like isoleucine patch superfamily enzyme